MSAQPKIKLTAEEYLAIERRAEYKSEYHDGETFAMAGASPAHNAITMNVGTQLNLQLRNRPCVVFSGDQRIRVEAADLFTYAGVTVVCGKPQFRHDGQLDNLLNPTLIVEVLSPSTEGYDRGDKFADYRLLESLQEYVLVSQDKRRVEHYVRQADGNWLYGAAQGLDASLHLPSIGCTLALADVYDKVDFETA
jgi:Uma2 family endonuclease